MEKPSKLQPVLLGGFNFTLILAPGDHIEEIAAIDYFTDWLRHFTDLIGTTPQELSMIRDADHTRKCIKRARTRS